MEETLQLQAELRQEAAKQNHQIRLDGMLPAVLYGHGIKNKNLKVSRLEFEKIYQKAKESSLVDLIIDQQNPIKVLIQEVQKEVVSDNILHVDFYQVRMDEKVTAEINLIFVGVAPAVKELGGVLVKNHDTIKIKCYPKDLIKEYKVDISSLKIFADRIYAKNLILPSSLELLTEPDVILVQVTPPRSDEELKSLEVEVKEDVSKVEGVEKEVEKEGAEETVEKAEVKKEDQKKDEKK